MLKRLLAMLLLAGLVFGGLFGWKYHQVQEALQVRATPPPAVVAVTQVREESWQPYLSAVGDLTAVSGIEVSSELPGKVVAIHFDSAQAVQRGTLLAELDTSTDSAELNKLLAARRLTRIHFDRQAELWKKRATSKSDLDQARAALDEAHAAVDEKQAQIAKKHIHAPFDGTLGIRQMDVGQYMAAGSPIVSLQALDPVYADFTLPEQQLARVQAGDPVKVHTQAFPEEDFVGRITAIDPGVDRGTRSVMVRATLSNADRRLRPGMFAEVRVLAGAPRPVLTLPDTAITYNPYGDTVFVLTRKDGVLVVQRHPVETGETRQGRVEILAGLVAGERVVGAGQVKLRNDMPVQADDKPPPSERDQGQ